MALLIVSTLGQANIAGGFGQFIKREYINYFLLCWIKLSKNLFLVNGSVTGWRWTRALRTFSFQQSWRDLHHCHYHPYLFLLKRNQVIIQSRGLIGRIFSRLDNYYSIAGVHFLIIFICVI